MINSLAEADDTMAPVISIIVPTRNRPALLEKALFAIASQTYRDFEVIVVDDGSEPATHADYAALWSSLDHRFRLHPVGGDSIKGVGPSVTRNFGMALARGDIIAFCDDDDFWTASEHLNTIATTFATTPAIDMYIANQTGVSARGVEIADWMKQLNDVLARRASRPAAGGSVTIEELCSAGGFAHLNILAVRKSVALEAGGFWERVGYEEDRDFFWRAADCSDRIYFNPAIIGQHNIPDPKRMDNQSTQHSRVERWLLACLVCQHISTSVSDLSIAGLARRYEGDLLRKLALHFGEQGQAMRAADYGRKALAARFSIKWAIYLVALSYKAFSAKRNQ